jgi:hypothetical protein
VPQVVKPELPETELAEIIDVSWARETPIPPYHIYLKIAYHLSQEARVGLSQFKIPKDFGNQIGVLSSVSIQATFSPGIRQP